VKTGRTNVVRQATGNLMASLCMHTASPSQIYMYSCLLMRM